MIKLFNIILGILLRLLTFLILLLNGNLRAQLKSLVYKIQQYSVHKDIPAILYHAVLLAEDKRYLHHYGVDFYSILRALRNNFFRKRFEGASTVAQQLVRTLTDDRSLTVRRKIKEVCLATAIDLQFDKAEILFAYFNCYKFGIGSGVLALCRKEGFQLHLLSGIEFAPIAARFKYPVLSTSNYIAYLKRVRKIEKLLQIYQNADLNHIKLDRSLYPIPSINYKLSNS